MTTKSIHPRLRQALRRWERWRLLHWAWRQLPMAGLLLGVLALTLAMVGPNLADAGVSVPWLLALLPPLLLAYPSWRWWRWRTPGNLAEDLEDHLSHRADELFSAAVSFCHNGGEGASWMQWRTIVHAIRLAERIAPKGALRWRPTGTWPALGIGLGLTAVLAVAILPGWRESLLYSLAPTRLSIALGQVTVLWEHPASIHATLGEHLPIRIHCDPPSSSGQLHVHYDDGQRETLPLQPADGVLITRLRPRLGQARLQARVAGGRSRWHQLLVSQPPKVHAVRMVLEPPAYTGQASRELLPGSHQVLAGSRLAIATSLGETVSAVHLVDTLGTSRPLEATGPGRYQIRISVHSEQQLHLELQTADGHRHRHASRWHLQAHIDQPPSICWQTTTPLLAVGQEAGLQLAWQTQDDLDISRLAVALHYPDGGQETRTLPVTSTSWLLDAASLGLPTGSLLGLQLQVQDSGGQMGRSQLVVARIVSDAEARQLAETRQLHHSLQRIATVDQALVDLGLAWDQLSDIWELVDDDALAANMRQELDRHLLVIRSLIPAPNETLWPPSRALAAIRHWQQAWQAWWQAVAATPPSAVDLSWYLSRGHEVSQARRDLEWAREQSLAFWQARLGAWLQQAAKRHQHERQQLAQGRLGLKWWLRDQPSRKRLDAAAWARPDSDPRSPLLDQEERQLRTLAQLLVPDGDADADLRQLLRQRPDRQPPSPSKGRDWPLPKLERSWHQLLAASDNPHRLRHWHQQVVASGEQLVQSRNWLQQDRCVWADAALQALCRRLSRPNDPDGFNPAAWQPFRLALWNWYRAMRDQHQDLAAAHQAAAAQWHQRDRPRLAASEEHRAAWHRDCLHQLHVDDQALDKPPQLPGHQAKNIEALPAALQAWYRDHESPRPNDSDWQHIGQTPPTLALLHRLQDLATPTPAAPAPSDQTARAELRERCLRRAWLARGDSAELLALQPDDALRQAWQQRLQHLAQVTDADEPALVDLLQTDIQLLQEAILPGLAKQLLHTDSPKQRARLVDLGLHLARQHWRARHLAARSARLLRRQQPSPPAWPRLGWSAGTAASRLFQAWSEPGPSSAIEVLARLHLLQAPPAPAQAAPTASTAPAPPPAIGVWRFRHPSDPIAAFSDRDDWQRYGPEQRQTIEAYYKQLMRGALAP